MTGRDGAAVTRHLHILGVWTCPSGTRVVVFLERDTGEAVRQGTCEWYPTLPRSEEDLIDWGIRIRPGIVAAAKEYLELTGPGRVVQL